MKLIIKEYLTLLKESDELDSLLPDLLLSMGTEPISRPQKGVRQDGVDVAAVGVDENGIKTLFLFTIKQGDIGRSDWDGNNQAIRSSLNEIKDKYLTSGIDPRYKALPKIIVLCTGGDLKQEAEKNWNNFIDREQEVGRLEYEFWGGDKLAILIERHMFNETIIPTELQSRLRKVLALLSDPDYDLIDYYYILDNLLFKIDYGDITKQSTRKKVWKSLRTISLCQNIVFYWSKEEGDLRPAINCSERTVLNGWEFIRKNNLYKSKKTISIFNEFYKTLFNVYTHYFTKIQKHCYVPNGFSGYCNNHIQENLNLFEHLGFISTGGLLCLYDFVATNNEELFKSSKIVTDALKNFLKNNLALRSPCYDEHIIEISEAILLLTTLKEDKFVNEWIEQIVEHIVFAYNSMGQYFPIQSDSFDDLVALNISKSMEKEELFKMSTLLPILAHWSATLGLNDTYTIIQNISTNVFPQCTLQIWYPDENTDEQLYTCNASRSGATEAPILLPSDVEEMKKLIQQVQKNTIKFRDISSIKHGLNILPIIASRHFRTPFLPFFWQINFIEK